MEKEGRSLSETPTWAVATVVTGMVALGFLAQRSLERFGKWLDRTKRKSLLAALEKIKEELMLFGLLSLLMGHWIFFVAKICVKSSILSSRFHPCASEGSFSTVQDILVSTSSSNYSLKLDFQVKENHRLIHHYCPEGQESFASYESLEQLHRLVFVLGVVHVSYSFVAVAMALVKIHSWRIWEDEAKSITIQSLQDASKTTLSNNRLRRLSTFIDHNASHPWSQNRVLVWLLCFSRQFWCSINRFDYMALRLGFINTHQLPLSYDFLSYMLRSMDDEFRDIVGISVPLWIYAICCIFLDFHGSNIYFWASFLPAILILLIGTKLHQVVIKLAIEIMDRCPFMEHHHQFNLRDELFWFGKPKLLLQLLHLISFQNAFEMATFIWSLWEMREPSCFMENHAFLAIRLAFGVISQFWCSFITFPLYVIITQMGSRFKKSVISENVRDSLSTWQRRAKEKHRSSHATPVSMSAITTSSDSVTDEAHYSCDSVSNSTEKVSSSVHEIIHVQHHGCCCVSEAQTKELPSNCEKLQLQVCSGSLYYTCDDEYENKVDESHNVEDDDSCLLPPP